VPIVAADLIVVLHSQFARAIDLKLVRRSRVVDVMRQGGDQQGQVLQLRQEGPSTSGAKNHVAT
jgi:hypothetical protein